MVLRRINTAIRAVTKGSNSLAVVHVPGPFSWKQNKTMLEKVLGNECHSHRSTFLIIISSTGMQFSFFSCLNCDPCTLIEIEKRGLHAPSQGLSLWQSHCCIATKTKPQNYPLLMHTYYYVHSNLPLDYVGFHIIKSMGLLHECKLGNCHGNWIW